MCKYSFRLISTLAATKEKNTPFGVEKNKGT